MRDFIFSFITLFFVTFSLLWTM